MPTLKNIKENPYNKYFSKLAKIESGNNPKAKAKTSSAAGLLQFTEGTWKNLSSKYNLGYTLDDRYDPNKSKKVAELFTRENENILTQALNRDINDGERYLGHFLGAQGAKNLLLANPEDNISSIVSPQALKANRSIFYNKDGSEKKVSDIKNWANKKMSVENDEVVTTNVSDLLYSNNLPTFTGVPETQYLKEDKDVLEVKQQIKEYDFLKDLQDRPIILTEKPFQPIQNKKTDYLTSYKQISDFIDNPVLQQGGQIGDLTPEQQKDIENKYYIQQGNKFTQDEINFLSELSIKDNKGQWKYPGQITEINSPNITMNNVQYPVLGISKETGEQKIMLPNKNYTFKNTKNVIEIPYDKKR